MGFVVFIQLLKENADKIFHSKMKYLDNRRYKQI